MSRDQAIKLLEETVVWEKSFLSHESIEGRLCIVFVDNKLLCLYNNNGIDKYSWLLLPIEKISDYIFDLFESDFLSWHSHFQRILDAGITFNDQIMEAMKTVIRTNLMERLPYESI